MSLHPRKIETRYTSKICTIQKIMIHSEERKIKVGVDRRLENCVGCRDEVEMLNLDARCLGKA